jgi:hypothetical protein
VAGAAAALGGDFTPALDQCRIDRLAAPLRRELVEMLRQGLRVGVRQILDERGHDLDATHPFAHQDQLVLQKEFRLAGQ